MNNIKIVTCTIFGAIGSIITNLFGGWTGDMTTLIIFIGIDLLLGLIVAAAFQNSNKTASGGVSSNACFKGLLKKFAMILIVFMAYRLDVTMGVAYLKTATIIAFIIDETVSIVENVGLMGVPLPKKLKKAIDILKSQNDENEEYKKDGE